jgi:hypothetical protein
MNSPVNTIPAHRRIVKDDQFSQSVKCGGTLEVLEKGEFEKRYTNPDYVLWEGHAGFVFLDKTDLYVSRYNYTTNIEQPYLELRIEHGANPTGATYAYAVIPYADEKTLENYAKKPDVTILSNTDKLQAVRENGMGLSSFIFYEAGECECVKVDTGAIVMLKESENEVEFSICDATHGYEELTAEIKMPLELVSADNKVSVSTHGGVATVKVNCAGAMGAPFRATFKKA